MLGPPPKTRCGFAAIVGRENVGKSTLLNRLLGTKVAIVTPKAQTTRTRIEGIVTREAEQIIWVDTPGFCRDRGPLTKVMRHAASTAAADADVIVVMVEARPSPPAFDHLDADVFTSVAQAGKPCIVALNKVDRIAPKQRLLPWMAALATRLPDAPVVPMSAHTGEGVAEMRMAVLQQLPRGPMLYDEDAYTDQTEQALCAEMVREQLLLCTQQEVPHGAAVRIDAFEDGRHDARPLCRIVARIVVARESHRPIVIGRRGEQVKRIGQAARMHMEQLLGCQVYLRLTVHVDRTWSLNQAGLERFGVVAALS